MRTLAYILNRYPEASLTALRREITAIQAQGMTVHRFAHRPSAQPLASEKDRLEAGKTCYLAQAHKPRLAFAFLRRMVRSPGSILRACKQMRALRVSPLKFLAYLMIASRLYEALTAARVERLHSHFAGNASIVAMLCRLFGGPRWSMTVHGPEDVDPVNWSRLAVLTRFADPILAISRHTAAAINALPDMQRRRVLVAEMGVSAQHLTVPKPVPVAGPLLCIARLEARKGVHHLIQAMDVVCGSAPGLRLLVVGDGPMRPALTRQLRSSRCSSIVELCGWKNEQQVIELLDSSRFLVLPSLSEGLPVCVLEALARSRPVVATELSGVRDLIHDAGGGGSLVAPGDPAALAQAILAMAAKSPEELFEMGSIGRRYVAQHHDADQNSRRLLDHWT
jgi:glycosyltransferase involved in cell wall biosynthesis